MHNAPSQVYFTVEPREMEHAVWGWLCQLVDARDETWHARISNDFCDFRRIELSSMAAGCIPQRPGHLSWSHCLCCQPGAVTLLLDR